MPSLTHNKNSVGNNRNIYSYVPNKLFFQRFGKLRTIRLLNNRLAAYKKIGFYGGGGLL